MKSRMQKYVKLGSHPVLGVMCKRLSESENETVLRFISENEGLDFNEFAVKVNRWLLDQPKPKNYSSMWALLCEVNSIKEEK